MTCIICGEQVPQNNVICIDCLRELGETVVQKRNQVINDVMKQVAQEADKVYEKDPTRGRGRGPKWMDG